MYVCIYVCVYAYMYVCMYVCNVCGPASAGEAALEMATAALRPGVEATGAGLHVVLTRTQWRRRQRQAALWAVVAGMCVCVCVCVCVYTHTDQNRFFLKRFQWALRAHLTSRKLGYPFAHDPNVPKNEAPILFFFFYKKSKR